MTTKTLLKMVILKLVVFNECIFNKGTKLDCGIVIYVINQIILRVNQDILDPNLFNTKKNLVLLLKNMNL